MAPGSLPDSRSGHAQNTRDRAHKVAGYRSAHHPQAEQRSAELDDQAAHLRRLVAEAITATPHADLGLSPRDRPETRGILHSSVTLAERYPFATGQAAQAALAAGSPFLDGLFRVYAQYREVDKAATPEEAMQPRPAVVVATRSGGLIRSGFFSWLTDRDAFIRDLLGDVVPRSPRYRPTAPVAPIDIESNAEELAAFLGVSPERVRATRRSHRLSASDERRARRAIARSASESTDPGIAAAARAVFGDASEIAAAMLPTRMLAALVRGGKLPRADAQWQFVTLIDGDAHGIFGLAMWPASHPELYRYRAPLAAHLRYLFDRRVAPWNRWSDPTRKREVFLLFWSRRLGIKRSIPALAAGLHARFADAYRGDDISKTVTRLEYLRWTYKL